MPIRQQVVAIILAVIIFFVVVRMVYRRQLREEYSWLWLLTSGFIIFLTLNYRVLESITALIGMVLPSSTLFFFSTIFLMALGIHFSLRLTEYSYRIKNLSQELAILKTEVAQLKEQADFEHND